MEAFRVEIGRSSMTIQPTWKVAMMRSLFMVLVAMVGGLAACTKLQNVQCDQDSNCNLSAGGVCTAAPTGNLWCSYPDPHCPSGYSYSTQAVGDGVSGACVAAAPTMDAGIDSGGPGAAADWVARYGGSSYDVGVAVASAPNGDLVMMGMYVGTITLGGQPLAFAAARSIWVAQFKADGTHIWSKSLVDGGPSTGAGLAVDQSGDVYIVGHFSGSVNFGGGVRPDSNSAFIVKLSGVDGKYQWDRELIKSTLFSSIALIGTDKIAVCGRFIGATDFGGGIVTSTPLDKYERFLAVYGTAASDHVWSKALAATSAALDACGVVGVDDDLMVNGDFSGTAMLGGQVLMSHGLGTDIYVARYRGRDGAHLWSMGFGGADGDAFAGELATDGSHVFVGGDFDGTVSLGGSELVGSGFASDAYVAAYNASDGSHLWSQRFGGMGEHRTTSIAANTTKLAIGINFSGETFTIGSHDFTAQSDDVVIARLDPTTGIPTDAATQFGGQPSSDPSEAPPSMALGYSFDRLIGVGTFSHTTMLFGSTLPSAGSNDIAAFRVDF
jgi:hypothetical protein